MEIAKFPEKTMRLKCPYCETVGTTNFITEQVFDSHDTYSTVKLQCSHCGYYLGIDDKHPCWSPDEGHMANRLIVEWKQKPTPVLNPCKLCGKKPSLSYASWMSRVQCPDCGITVRSGASAKAVEIWNKLMPVPEDPKKELPLIDDEDWEPPYPTSEDVTEMYKGMAAIVWGSVALLAVVGLLVWGAIKLFS